MQIKFLRLFGEREGNLPENLHKNKIRLVYSQFELNGSQMKVWNTGFISQSQLTFSRVTTGLTSCTSTTVERPCRFRLAWKAINLGDHRTCVPLSSRKFLDMSRDQIQGSYLRTGSTNCGLSPMSMLIKGNLD